VLTVDDHPLIRSALREVLEVVVGPIDLVEASTPAEGLTAANARQDVDLAFLDLRYEGEEGIAFIRQFRETAPSVPVIVYTMHEDPAVLKQAFACGAAGIVPKTHSSKLLQKAVELVMAGGVYVPPELARALAVPDEAKPGGQRSQMSPQQYRILELLAMGLANKEIARKLDIASSTVKNQLTSVFGKLGVSNRTQAAIAARSFLKADGAAQAAE
jgi:DNA-binding NarL/FixJ family response regulator